MTLEELDAEARMHGLHAWAAKDRHGNPKSYHVAVPEGRFTTRLADGRTQACSETLSADTVPDLAAMLRAYIGRGRHASGPAASQVREDTAMPYIGRRRNDAN